MTRFAWGVDIKPGGLAIGVVSFEPVEFAFATEWYAAPPKGKERVQVVRRFHDLRDHAEGMVSWVVEVLDMPPAVILLEDPKGRHRAPNLVAAWGIIGALLYDVAGEAVFTASARTWRSKLGLAAAKGDPKGPGLAYALDLGAPATYSEDCLEAVSQAAAAVRWLG